MAITTTEKSLSMRSKLNQSLEKRLVKAIFYLLKMKMNLIDLLQIQTLHKATMDLDLKLIMLEHLNLVHSMRILVAYLKIKMTSQKQILIA
jgi:uncharacterized membrane protein (DUF2068 family)